MQPISFFQTAWPILRVNLHLIIIVIAGILSFSVISQSQDYLNQFIVDYEDKPHNIINVALSFYLWSYIIYMSITLTIDKKEIVTKNHSKAIKIALWTPMLLSLLPSTVLTCMLLIKYNNNFGVSTSVNDMDKVWDITWILLFIIVQIMFTILTYLKFSLNNSLQNNLTSSSSLIYLFRRTKYKFYGLVALSLFSIVVLLIIFPEILLRGMSDRNWLNPLSAVGIGLSMYLIFFTLLGAFNIPLKKPLFIFLFLYMMLCSITNNNHDIETVYLQEENVFGDVRNSLNEDFLNWVKNLNITDSQLTEIPVYIIAHQGGGIRGMSWSSRVLNELDSIPGFYDHIYAMTGASGGCNGMITYNTLKFFNENKSAEELNPILDTILDYDYLTPTLASLLIVESVQFLLPFPIKHMDRGRIHANSFNKGFSVGNQRRMDVPTLSMYTENKEKLNCYQSDKRIPHMLINGTIAEAGQRIIYSTLKLPNSFEGDVDLLKIINSEKGYPTSDLKIKDAMLMCCRFGFILPGGTVPLLTDSLQSIGNVVDGGYLENTGLITAINLANEIDSIYTKFKLFQNVSCNLNKNCLGMNTCAPSRPHKECKHLEFKPLKITIIYVSNGNYHTPNSKAVKASRETTLPMKALYLSRERAAEVASSTTISTLINKAGFEYYSFYLPRIKEEDLALGWAMSDSGLSIIKRYASNFNKQKARFPKNADSFDTLYIQQNYNFYEQIKNNHISKLK